MNIIRALLVMLVMGLIMSFGAVSIAQTPDGITPSEEMGCDGLLRAAFGLCNAYCEALDCNSNVGYEQHPNACDNVLGNYQDITGYPGPPCSCYSVCQRESNMCYADCGTDTACQNICCNNHKTCSTECCDQAKDQNRVRVERCVKKCKGDEECIIDCSTGILCGTPACAIQLPR